MTTAAFSNIRAHEHVNPTLPVVAELIRRRETVYSSGSLRAAGGAVRAADEVLGCLSGRRSMLPEGTP